jgi:hypothetical protein
MMSRTVILIAVIAGTISACSSSPEVAAPPSGSPGAGTAPSASPTVARSPAPTPSSSSSDPFAGLPYELALPPGWFGGSADSFKSAQDAFASENPGDAAKVRELSPPLENEFVAFDGSVPYPLARSCAVNTLPAGGLSDTEVLALSERQNLDGIRQLPSTVGTPVADRVHLTVGDAVRIRWTSRLVTNGATETSSTVGFSFPAKDTVFTIVCSASEADDGADAMFKALVDSFRVK